MDVDEIAPGLWHWTARHPEWTPESDEGGEGWEEIVSSYALVGDDGVVLFDPQVPPEETEARRFWDALDRDVGAHGPPAILITIFWHARSSQLILERYRGATLWAHEPAAEWIGERVRYTDTFNVGDELARGVEAVAMHRAKEVAYWLDDHGAVVVGDAILGRDGRATLPPPSWVQDDEVRAASVEAVRELMRRAPARLLLTHGGPTDPRALEV